MKKGDAIKRILQKIREIEESLGMIEQGTPAALDEFKASGLVKDGICKRLEFCIQSIIDIFSIIYSIENIGVPETGDDIFIGLEKKEIFSKKVLSLVHDMKGMRNILAHKYGNMDDEIVYENVTERFSDFQRVIDAIEAYLDKPKK